MCSPTSVIQKGHPVLSMYLNYIKIVIVLGLIIAIPSTYKVYSNIAGGQCDKYFLLSELPLKERPLAPDRPSQSPHPEGHIEYLDNNDTSVNPALRDTYITIEGQQRSATVVDCYSGFVNRPSIANYGPESDYIYVILVVAAFFSYWCLHGYIAYRVEVYTHRVEKKFETFVDYSVEIKHIGSEISKSDIVDYFKK